MSVNKLNLGYKEVVTWPFTGSWTFQNTYVWTTFKPPFLAFWRTPSHICSWNFQSSNHRKQCETRITGNLLHAVTTQKNIAFYRYDTTGNNRFDHEKLLFLVVDTKVAELCDSGSNMYLRRAPWIVNRAREEELSLAIDDQGPTIIGDTLQLFLILTGYWWDCKHWSHQQQHQHLSLPSHCFEQTHGNTANTATLLFPPKAKSLFSAN